MISVVIFTRDDAEWLARCLGALRDRPGREAVEVLVFDNASRDGSAELVRAWRGADGRPAALFRAERDTAFSVGNNVGLTAARGELTLFLNPDTEPDGAVLDACAAVARRDGVGLVGPRLRFVDGAAQPNGWALPSPLQLLRERAFGAPRWMPPTGPGAAGGDEAGAAGGDEARRVEAGATPVGWLMGCFLLGSTAGLRALGGFDEDFWFHGTDLEICARVRASGRTIVRVEEVELLHRGHRTWEAARIQATRGATAQWLARDHGPLVGAAARVAGAWAPR